MKMSEDQCSIVFKSPLTKCIAIEMLSTIGPLATSGTEPHQTADRLFFEEALPSENLPPDVIIPKYGQESGAKD
jgi:hypothetical protein